MFLAHGKDTHRIVCESQYPDGMFFGGYNMLTCVDHLGHSNSYFKGTQEATKLKGRYEAMALAKSQGFDGVTFLGVHYTINNKVLSDDEVRGVSCDIKITP